MNEYVDIPDSIRQGPASKSGWRFLGDLIRQGVHYRYGLGMLVLLSFWVAIVGGVAPQSIVGNALLLDTYGQLYCLATLNTMAAVFCLAILRILNGRYPSIGCWTGFRYWVGSGDSKWKRQQVILVGLVAVLTPLHLAIVYGSEFSGLLWAGQEVYGDTMHVILVSIVLPLGFATGGVLLMLLGRVKTRLFGSHANLENYLPFEDVERKGWLSQFPDWVVSIYKKLPLEEIDVQLGIYVSLLALFHYGSTRYLVDWITLVASAPFVGVLVIWLTGMLMTGLAYWCDMVRFPVTLLLFLGMFFTNLVFEQNHYLITRKDSSKAKFLPSIHRVLEAERNAMIEGDRRQAVLDAAIPLEEQSWNAIATRMDRISPSPKKRTVVLVTCPGGGIHAAAWSTYILEDLCKQFPKFRDSICLISGVSGGSVGALYFVSSTYSEELNSGTSSETKHSAFESATTSSLEQIAVGLMTDDLYGAFFPPLSGIDRGQRLENSFLKRLPKSQQIQTLNNWGDKALSGEIPIVVFNATDAVTGRRILFDSVPTPMRKSNISLTSRPFNYRELLPPSKESSIDLSPITAARTSASFPYVSTFTKPDKGSDVGRGVALGDGGYVDNEGIVTALDWIQFLRERWSKIDVVDRPFEQILIIRIAPSVNSDSLEPPSSKWLVKNLRWLTGPLETIANVRSTSQAERGNLETDLATLYLEPPQRSPEIDDSEPSTIHSDNDPALTYSENAETNTLTTKNRTREEAAKNRFEKRMQRDNPGLLKELKAEPERSEENPSVTATFGSTLPKANLAPAIVVLFPFETESETQIVPLNWKLSRDQKKWYQAAWQRVQKLQSEDMQLMEELFGDR